MMEIEKKFLIKQFPAGLDSCGKKEIEQGYLNTHPTLRIRKSNDDYILTYKKGASGADPSTICNTEIEAELDEESYLHLKEKIDDGIVAKTRYLIPLGTCAERCPGVAAKDKDRNLTAELDVFRGRLEGLVFAEVEFPSVDAAEHFAGPDWLGEDVSADRRLRNSYLAKLPDTSVLADLIDKSPKVTDRGI